MLDDLELRMPGEHLVHDHRGHRVVDRAVVEQDLVQRILLAETLERRLAAPQRRDGQVATVRQVEAHGNTGFGQPRPHRVVHRIAQRARLDHTGHRRGPHQHHLGAARQARTRPPRPPCRGSASEMIGAETIRWSGRSKPQSSSSHRLNACTDAIVASMSCLSASSTPQANVGSMNTVSSSAYPGSSPAHRDSGTRDGWRAGRPSSATPGRRPRGSHRGTADRGIPAR